MPRHEQYPWHGSPQEVSQGCKVQSERVGGQMEGVDTQFSAGEVTPGITDPARQGAVSLGSTLDALPSLPPWI